MAAGVPIDTVIAPGLGGVRAEEVYRGGGIQERAIDWCPRGARGQPQRGDEEGCTGVDRRWAVSSGRDFRLPPD